MKTTTIALVAVLMAAATPSARALPGFRALSAASVEQRNYEQGRGLALDLIRRARPALSGRNVDIADTALRQLAGARFLASSDRQGWPRSATNWSTSKRAHCAA